MNLKIGDSIIVKEGIKEPDSEEFEIGGWQGRVIEIDNDTDKNNDDFHYPVDIFMPKHSDF